MAEQPSSHHIITCSRKIVNLLTCWPETRQDELSVTDSWNPFCAVKQHLKWGEMLLAEFYVILLNYNVMSFLSLCTTGVM